MVFHAQTGKIGVIGIFKYNLLIFKKIYQTMNIKFQLSLISILLTLNFNTLAQIGDESNLFYQLGRGTYKGGDLNKAMFSSNSDVTLCNENGKPGAFISFGNPSIIYLLNGTPGAFLHDYGNNNIGVVGFNGKFLGWYEKGILHDRNGYAVCATINSGLTPAIDGPKGPKGPTPPMPPIPPGYDGPKFSFFGDKSLANLLYSGVY